MYVNEMTDRAVRQTIVEVGETTPAGHIIQKLYDEVKHLKEAEAGAEILIKEYEEQLKKLMYKYLFWENQAQEGWLRCEDCNGEYPQITEQEPLCSSCKRRT